MSRAIISAAAKLCCDKVLITVDSSTVVLYLL